MNWLARLGAAMFAMIAATTVADDSPSQEPAAANQERTGVLFDLRGPIGPATSDFFVRTLEDAARDRAELVVVKIDTPGGLDTAMRDMIQAILAAPMPIVMYVAPSGARAASAGTYLLYASHVAAMAPATNLGAATPVSIGGPTPAAPGAGDHGSSPDEEQDGESPPAAAKPAAPEPGGAMERKAVNDAVAYIRSLAELRGRNADWAEEAVRGAASLSAQQALELGVVDLIAEGVPDLLEQIDGRQVKVASGEITIESGSLVLERVEMDWRTRLLAVITNPTTAYLLMLVGIYGLLLEGYNPGAILPGVVGAISLLLALFAFQVLSVNYAGLALILLGVLLIVAEAFAPSFGALGLGGIIAFVIGSIVLLDTDIPGLAIARPLIAAMGFVGGLATLGIVTFAVRSRDRPIVAGREQLLHETAVALCDFDREGTVRLHGEIWQARSAQSVVAGQRLRIVAVEGLTLTVEPLPDGSP